MKHSGGSVLVRGCMSAAGIGTLHFIEGMMNRRVYIDILKCSLSSSAEKMDIKNNFIFMQNNDPKPQHITQHTSVFKNSSTISRYQSHRTSMGLFGTRNQKTSNIL